MQVEHENTEVKEEFKPLIVGVLLQLVQLRGSRPGRNQPSFLSG